MMLGYIQSDIRGETDRILSALALRMRPDIAAFTSPDPDDNLLVHLWPADQHWPIRQRLGKGASSCTLDSGALEEAVFHMSQDLAHLPASTPLILNKFGKQEAENHGTRPLIAQSLALGRRVLLAVPRQTETAFHQFAGPLAQKLKPDIHELEAFLRG